MLAAIPGHENVVRLWSHFKDEEAAPKVLNALPDFVLTRFRDKVSLNAAWKPKVRARGHAKCQRNHSTMSLGDCRP